MYKFVVLAACMAAAQAGLIGAPVAYGAPAIGYGAVGSSAQSTLRSLDGNSVVSQYSKAVDTPFSSVRKYDTRITNDAQYLAPAYAAPIARAYAPAIAAPAYAAPLAARAYAAPAVAHPGLLGVAYSAAPAVSHISFDGFGAHYGW